MTLSQDLKRKAVELGFDLVGITDASPIDSEQVELLTSWLNSGYAGRMDYMRRNFDKRINPAELLENAQSVICIGLNYTPPEGQEEPLCQTVMTGRVASYAQYEDYHSFIKKRLRKLADFMISTSDIDLKFKICVDSVPLAERALAVRAGLGFIGKNYMLINPEFGCRIFLGEIITTLKLPTDRPIINSCSGCDKCIDACPTGALRPDGQFDAGRCISYLTIEHKGRIPFELTEKMGNWLFGCDECILACPYQENVPKCGNKQFKFYSNRVKLSLRDILSMDEGRFEARFADSPVKRLGLAGLKRNARICLANISSRLV